jgi:hypothetical protein
MWRSTNNKQAHKISQVMHLNEGDLFFSSQLEDNIQLTLQESSTGFYRPAHNDYFDKLLMDDTSTVPTEAPSLETEDASTYVLKHHM